MADVPDYLVEAAGEWLKGRPQKTAIMELFVRVVQLTDVVAQLCTLCGVPQAMEGHALGAGTAAEDGVNLDGPPHQHKPPPSPKGGSNAPR